MEMDRQRLAEQLGQRRRSRSAPLRLWRRTRRRLAALGGALLLVLALPAAAGLPSMQVLAADTGSGAAAGGTSRKQWWDLARSHPCGRMWCSRVVSPHIPLAPGDRKLTLAVPGSVGREGENPATLVESRSGAVSTTLNQLGRRLARRARTEPPLRQEGDLGFWLQRRKPLHPLTPELAIGRKNGQPVIYLPADGQHGTPAVTLVTLTEPDALANDADLDALAGSWKGMLETALSDFLWSASFDRRFPWVRSSAAVLVIGLAAALAALCTRARQLVERRQRERQASLAGLHEAERSPGGAGPDGILEGTQQVERHRTLAALAAKSLGVIRIAAVVTALIVGLYLFPSTRMVAVFLLLQSTGVPLIWIGMIALEALLVWAMMRRLNRWAEDAQAADPASSRPNMRLVTGSRVLRGSIATGTTLLGIYLTLLLFGIDPRILAGAGILAVGLGFLARGLLEDMMSGILILAGDHFAIGDSIRVNGHAGLVEGMNLARTQLRGGEGELVTIPNRLIQVVENRSKDWARVNFEIDIAWGSDLEQACRLLEEVAAQLHEDPQWRPLILEPPTLLGVEMLQQSGVRLKLWIRTQPLKQWPVGREYRRRIKHAFDAAGIEPGMPQQWVRIVGAAATGSG